ncbi:MAG TPA: ribbon-helix-helix protein, CopG family [Bryobacteraceae bacterium]|jgi:metal-responsive CopG/Arc/MetJ family transcriptional regulator
MRTTETLTISLPPAMAKQMEHVQKTENRTRSELLREAWRQYFESRYPSRPATNTEAAAIRKGRAAFKKGEYITLNQLHDELDTARHTARKKSARKTS